jgi:pyruvate dehydrogenase E2 component (dihydrolipoamide acetyltransferase)
VIPPQAAALAAGAVRETLLLDAGGLIGSRPMTATLACDHRILYGARAAAFLRSVSSRLEQAEL